MEGLFQGHSINATDDDGTKLLCCLSSEQVAITSCARFATVLNSQRAVKVFVVRHSLDRTSYDLLCFATRCSEELEESAVDWLVWQSFTEIITR